MNMQMLSGLAGGGRPQRAVQTHLQKGVGHQRHQRGCYTGRAAQAPGDERIERARVRDPPRHRHIPGRENPQNHRDHQERGRDRC